MVGLKPFASWLALLAAAAAWGAAYCGQFDFRKSTHSCAVLLGGTGCASQVPGCLSTYAIKRVSPRWLSSIAGDGGPLLTWVPLAFYSREPARSRRLLQLALLWYLALIVPVRHTHRALESRWDPSGHIFVYGAQLVCAWTFPHAHCARLLAAWALVLLYLSFLTAAFWHTASEVSAAVLFSAALLLLLQRPALAEVGGGKRLCALCIFVTWLALTAAAWSVEGRISGVMRAAVAYDASLWLLFICIECASERVDRERGAELRGVASAADKSSSDSLCDGGCGDSARRALLGGLRSRTEGAR